MVPATTLQGYVATTLQLAVLRALQGFAMAAIVVPALARASDLSSSGTEGRQIIILSMGLDLGTAVGLLLSGFLAIYSFGLPFLAGGLLSLAGMGIVYAFVSSEKRRED